MSDQTLGKILGVLLIGIAVAFLLMVLHFQMVDASATDSAAPVTEEPVEDPKVPETDPVDSEPVSDTAHAHQAAEELNEELSGASIML